jgi:hypothetical protein
MGIKEHTFQPLPENALHQELVPKDNLNRLEQALDLVREGVGRVTFCGGRQAFCCDRDLCWKSGEIVAIRRACGSTWGR